MASYKNLIVWQKSKMLAVKVYAVTDHFPQSEMFGLTSQIRRSAVSIPSNIAEGSYRSGVKEFKNFLHIAYGSGGELETQLEIAKELHFIKNEEYTECIDLLSEIMKMLNSMIASDLITKH
ncbi:hypothetical protein COU15_02810 [Candidatus Kaiserbacteria bacterium CG10_big_fil_rev_8_21_14_0_10_45_20]|uniref:Four helix bundle protein n=1 Tax=Candidatus Kaiserbacteria bacterium CG10_big_fil_rev_8_21_14_0_10_45_20 TaxID=1974607 RepID=A0A2H0UF94_9BACT|nr:MAG: hypothetical protein COU15_02810 [Candidatus Kaiserbacteria bacterium CG10_big_fil_rev_8_21_14_0_10_45_20]